MPVRSLNFLKELPPARSYAGHPSPVESTEEYKDCLLMLGAGLKPQEYLELYFPKEHSIYRVSKFPLNAALNLLKRKVKELQLPYDCYIRADKLYIVGRGVIS